MMISVGGHQALKDMVEFQMYLVAQSQQAPWPMLPRRTKTNPAGKKPNAVESSTASELIERGFIEQTSSLTFVVSRSGQEFYDREMKGRPA
jgi:hypothetical protein